MSFIIIWKVASKLHSPKNMMSGSKSPWFMEKAAFHSSPSFSWTLLKPQQRSKVVNHSTSCSLVSRSEEHTSELQSHSDLVCRLLLEKKKKNKLKRVILFST